MIRAVIFGYGNIGKYVAQAIDAAPDFELAGVVSRSQKGSCKYGITFVESADDLPSYDVAILCGPSRSTGKMAADLMKQGIPTVDSFDIHSEIPSLRKELGNIARENNVSSIISAGWDPGTDSVVRALMLAMTPNGITYTDFGPGMSMGHTVAVKAVNGVKNALSMTIPAGVGIHKRMVYIELEDGYSYEQACSDIKNDPYFINDETHVIQVDDVNLLIDMGHGVHIERKGVSGLTANQRLSFDMSINNPALTAQILVASARAVLKQKPGCYTLIEIPPVDLLSMDVDEAVKFLV